MDWPQLLRDLSERGWTQVQIAARAGTQQSVISDLARGEIKTPKFDIGQAIVELHRESEQKAA